MNLVNLNTQTMSSREIAELLGKEHANLKISAERLAFKKVISTLAVQEFTHNGNTYTEYLLNKRDSLILVAQNCPEFTAAIVDRWQELEAQLAPKLPQTMAEALRLAADQAEQIEQQQKQLQLAAPAVAFVESFVERTALQNATQVGQTFGMSAVKLNRVLDEIGGVYNRSCKRGRAFVQSWIESGFGEMKQNDMGHPQALFTTKGIQHLAAKFSSEGMV